MKKENKETKIDETTLNELNECICDETEETPSADEIATMFITPICKCDIGEAHFDADEFQRGLNEYSCLAGKFTALMNVGLTAEMALSYIVNSETAILTKEMNIEMAKHGAFAKDKDSL